MDRKNTKPTIAYLIADAQICGGVAVVCQHVNRLARRGFDACIVSTAGDNEIGWFPGQRVPVYPRDRMPDDIDIGVATWWETAHDLYRMNVPRKFYFVQSDETRFYREDRHERVFARETYRFDFELITEARWIREWLKEEFGREALYAPNGIDPEIFHPVDPLEPRGERPRVLIEGPADMPSKGVAEAFRAVSALGCEIWYVNYRGIPDPFWKADRYFYRVPMEEMKRIYSSCDILLKMSGVEGSFGPPLEMMACGGACVVSRVTGCDEEILPGENALVVDPGDVDAAAKAVRLLIDDAGLRRRLIEKGRETAARLDWEKTIDILEDSFLSPPPAEAVPGPRIKAMLREKESALIEAYARMKKAEETHEAEKRRLGRAIDMKNDELNDVYLSRQWKIAVAIKDARRSPKALLALPFRVACLFFGD